MERLQAGIKKGATEALKRLRIGVYRIPPEAGLIPDREYYHPLFSPWRDLGYGEFAKYLNIAKGRTLVSSDRLYQLFSICKQSLSLDGDIWECGVYKGGTAAMFAATVCDFNPAKRLHLFDTFEGMPETNAKVDIHRQGDFEDTDLHTVKEFVGYPDIAVYHPGFIPDTFKGLEGSLIAMAHVDVDIRQSVEDCCKFIFPRLVVGGFIVFDDYGFPSCPGARAAVDGYFSGSGIVPLVLPTGQAIVFKSK